MDSPLSEADSLSSAGATTEPLVGSDNELDSDGALSPSPAPRTASAARASGGNGNESDSSLTEQSDSEADPARDGDDEEDEDEDAVERGSAHSTALPDLTDEDEDEDVEPAAPPTPRGAKRARTAVEDDEEDGVDEERGAAGRQALIKRDEEDEDEELSPASDNTADSDHRPAASRSAPGATASAVKKARLRKNLASSVGDSLSELDDDDENDEQPKPSTSASSVPQAALTPVHDAANDILSEEETPLATLVASPQRGGAAGKKGGAPSTNAARGRARAPPSRPKGAAKPRSISPELGAVGDDRDATPRAEEARDAIQDDRPAQEADAVETLAAAAAAAPAPVQSRGAKGKARGRGRGRGRGMAAAAASRADRAESIESTSAAAADAAASSLLAAAAADSAAHREAAGGDGADSPALPSNLPAPSGLVELELDTAEPAAQLAEQLVELAAKEADAAAAGPAADGVAALVDASRADELEDEDDEREEEEGREDEDAQMVDSEAALDAKAVAAAEEAQAQARGGASAAADEAMQLEREQALEVEAEEVEVERARRAPPSAKKGAKGKGKGKGKGKEKVVELAETPALDDEDAHEGEEEEDASDVAFMRKRAEAMEALTKIEITFAKLRDLLYIERMADIDKERLAIETQTHPELIHLTQLIELRRNRRLELARKWLDGLECAYQVQFDERQHANWNSWGDDKSRKRTEMLDEANSKRRRLEREKRTMERPKDDSLASMLAPQPLPPIPLHHRRRLGFDGEPLGENEIAWALRHPDVRVDAAIRGLDDETTYGDLERMGLREPLRHSIYSYDAMYGAGIAYADPRSAGYPYSAYDPSSLALQQPHAFSASFGALPPLPQRIDQAPSRPPSNPRLAQGFPAELGGGQPGYPASAAQPRAYSNGHYPAAYAEHEAERVQQHQQQHAAAPAWQQKPALGFDDQRRRTASAGGSLGPMRSHDSLDAIAAQRQNGFVAAGAAAVAEHGASTGGRTTPTNASGKARFTLDEHMNTRSPTAASASATKTPASSASAAARGSPAFMSIPTIPPFDRNRHEQHLRAQAQRAATTPTANSPAPPVMPPLPAKQQQQSAASLFGQQAQSQQASQPAQANSAQSGQSSFPAYPVPQRAA
ncbi:hypothetical protein Rhopal_002334-T1 [Rhodotorula paludigena]|uniref:Sds3-like-domain-containing protein n=1 Tax=Rhodotorula paludigena TaxID=86838 RepID=A0AAV5GHJ2_9BASI|nr:hypothetical protein Rhopal_002334-T1 [Rhodotorula paludigena]